MERIKWRDELGSRRREAWLLLIKDNKIICFDRKHSPKTIPGVVLVEGTDIEGSRGIWSYTEYRLRLASGVRAIAGYMGWDTGYFEEGLARAVRGMTRETPATWAELATLLGVTPEAAKAFCAEHMPKCFQRIEAKEAEIQEFESSLNKIT